MNLSKLAVFCLSVLISSSIYAQNATVSGRIVDEKASPLPYTSIVLMHAGDSSAEQFTLSGDDGSFSFKKVPADSYILQALYAGFAVKNIKITVKDENPIVLGEISLEASSVTLKEAMVVAKKIPMVFRGDTIIYNPTAFNTKTNATVEDLLKKLPGVQVANDGTVVAQGEKVVKVLVNGKEFFGNDATKATQNLDADAIEKVEVLDKKTDEAEFSGVDDGTREKVINLVLKKDANKGYFGKLEAGAGTENTYRVKGVINRFNEDNQYTLIANTNNLNQNGFNWREYYQMLNGNGGVNFGNTTYWYSQNQWLGENQQGLQQNAVIGTNAALQIGKKKKGKLNASYFLMDRSNDLQSRTVAENYLPQRTIFSNSAYDAVTANGQHKLMGRYEFKPDTLNFFTVTGEADFKNGNSTTLGFQRNESDEGQLLNYSLSQTQAMQRNLNVKGSANYMRKFKKSKNYMVFESGVERNSGVDTSQWATTLDQSITDYTEQIPLQFSDNKLGTGLVLYNRVFGSVNVKGPWFLTLQLENKFSKDKFEQIRQSLSSDTISVAQSPDINTTNSTSKADFGVSRNSNANGSGWYVNFGVAGAQIDVTRNLSLLNSTELDFKDQYFFVLPHGYIAYRKPKAWRMGIWINASENLPGISQINPIPDVSNLVRINSGNFALAPTVSYNLGGHANVRNNAKSTFWYANFNTSVTPNAVVQVETRDSNNLSTSTFSNDGYSNMLSGSLYYQFPIKKLHLEISPSIDFSHYDFLSILNGVTYQNSRNTFGGGIDLSFELEKFEVDFEYGPSFTIQNSELLTNSVKYWRHNFTAEVHWDITDRMELSSEYRVFYFNSQQVGQQQVVPILNSGISYRLDSLDKWTISLTGYDMLNKAQSIDRNFFNNSFSETRQNTLTRYFMFNASYAIKKGKKKEEGRNWKG